MLDREILVSVANRQELLNELYPQFLGVEEKSIVGKAKDSVSPESSLAKSWIYDRYYPCVFATSFRILGDWQSAEDSTHESFISLFKYLERFQYKTHPQFRGYISRITKSRALDYRRSDPQHSSLDKKFSDTDADENDFSNPKDSMADLIFIPEEATPPSQVEATETSQELSAAVLKLTATQRTVLQLRFQQGLTVKETAFRLGKSTGNIKVQQHKGVKRLKKIMAG